MADKRDILIRLLGEETVSRMAGKAGDGLDRFGDKLDATEKDAKHLDRQIAEVEGSLKTLATAFARTNDAADRVDITKAMRKQQSELRKLTKAKDLLDFDKLGDDAASGFAARFGARVGPLMASMSGSGAAAAGVALGAAMAPTLMAGLAGAVVGGAGIGGIVGGVIIASRDPRVKAAGADLGTYIMGDLEDRAAAFTPVVLNSIDRIGKGWGAIGPDLDRIFSSSRLVEPLVAGMMSGGKKFIHGVADAVEKSEPVVAAFGRSFDAIGGATGAFFTKLSGDAKEGASAIDDLTNSVTSFIEVTGVVVHAGAAVKGWSNEVDVAIDKARYWSEDNGFLATRLRGLGIQVDFTADGFKAGSVQAEAYRKATLGTATVADFATLKLAGKTDAEIAGADASGTYRSKIDEVNNALGRTGPAVQPAIEGVRSLTEIMDDWAGKSITVEQAQSNLEQAIDDATAAAKRNGDGIDRNDPKQRANRDALVGIASAAKDAAAKIYAQTHSQEAASVATERGRTAFLTAAAAMKVEKGEAIALANNLFGIPSVKPKVTVQDAQAKAALAAIKNGIATIHDKNVTVSVKYETHGSVQGEHTIGVGTNTRASGGPIKAGTPYMVGEEGPELITPTADGYVHDARKTAQLRAAIRSGGSAPIRAGAGGGSTSAAPAQASPAVLAAAIRSALAGVTVQLDGRTVGYIQGRQADILSR